MAIGGTAVIQTFLSYASQFALNRAVDDCPRLTAPPSLSHDPLVRSHRPRGF